jgi:sugar phosphate isomerase/epimerase
MKLGACVQVFYHLKFSEALREARALGIEAIELPVHAGNPFVDLDDALKDGGARILGDVRAAGLEISALSNHLEGQLLLGPYTEDTDVYFKGDRAGKIAYAERRLTQTAELAHRMGVGVVTAFTGCEDYSRWFPWPLPDGYERMAPVFRERMLPLLDAFHERGVRFAHECHPRQFAYDLETAQWALRLVDDHPAWAFNLDPANLMIAGIDPTRFVAELGERVVHMHAKDAEHVAHRAGASGPMAHGAWNRRDRGFRFRVPGWGDVPWKALLTELQMVGYRGVVAIEHEDPTFAPFEGMRKAAAYLGPLLFQEPAPSGKWW